MHCVSGILASYDVSHLYATMSVINSHKVHLKILVTLSIATAVVLSLINHTVTLAGRMSDPLALKKLLPFQLHVTPRLEAEWEVWLSLPPAPLPSYTLQGTALAEQLMCPKGLDQPCMHCVKIRMIA